MKQDWQINVKKKDRLLASLFDFVRVNFIAQ